MNKHPILALLILLIAQRSVSGASSLDKSGKLAQHQSKLQSFEHKISPSPGPSPSPSPRLSFSPASNGDSGEKSSHDVLTPSISPVPAADPSGGAASERCLTTSLQCHDLGTMTACIQPSLNDPKQLYLLVQNDGDSPLKVNVTISHERVGSEDTQVPKFEAKKIYISTSVGENPSIVLNAGNGECVIHLGAPTSEGNFFKQLPYADHLTPIHGAYLLFSVALITGVVWACCKLRRTGRQGDDGVLYQELEMGQPESLSANNVETADWDEGWDDDWEETKAVQSPSGHKTGNLSGDGLNSKSTDRNGWDSDWNN